MTPERRAGYILAAFAVSEGAWVAINAWPNPQGFIAYLGFAAGRSGTASGWFLAALVTVGFVALAARLPSVRSTMFAVTGLKLLGLSVAVAAGILEEVVFRKLLMDYVQSLNYGAIAQVVASGLAFGLAHGIWGVFGKSPMAALGATLATGLLGLGLGMVYIVSGRSLAPCVAAHFLIDAFIEPGLMLAAARGEMARRRLPN